MTFANRFDTDTAFNVAVIFLREYRFVSLFSRFSHKLRYFAILRAGKSRRTHTATFRKVRRAVQVTWEKMTRRSYSVEVKYEIQRNGGLDSNKVETE